METLTPPDDPFRDDPRYTAAPIITDYDVNQQFAPAALAPIDAVRGQEILDSIADAQAKENTLKGRIMFGRYQAQYDPYLDAPPAADPLNVINRNDILSGVLGLATNPIIGAGVGEFLRSKETNPYLNTGTPLARMGGGMIAGSPIQPATDMQDNLVDTAVAQLSIDDPIIQQQQQEDILTDILLSGDRDTTSSKQYFTPSEAIQKRIRDNLAFGQSAI